MNVAMIFTLHRSIKDTSYTVTRPGKVFYTVRQHYRISVDKDYALSTGEGLPMFWWNTAPSFWTVGPEVEGK